MPDEEKQQPREASELEPEESFNQEPTEIPEQEMDLEQDPKETPEQKGNTKKAAKKKNEQRPPKKTGKGNKKRLHTVIRVCVAFILAVLVGCCFVGKLLPDMTILQKPQNAVSSVLSPIQSGFSSIVDSVVNFLYKIKLMATIEEEYNALRSENEELRNSVMLVRELQTMLDQYQSLSDEVRVNEMLNPLPARVIARESGNYFSVFTINVGTKDGVEDYMAVTMDGALVGYTYNVSTSTSTVRTIIDGEASIAALLSTSRDQGTIRGTLSVDGTPLCRMYYLPDDQLPRPGELVVTSGVGMGFPKGIPIGTVKESTRGMESNKSYVVVQPQADFEHIERVIVLRYQPEAGEVEDQTDNDSDLTIVALDTPLPVPTVHIGSEFFQLAPTTVPTDTPQPTTTVDAYGNVVEITPAPQDELSQDYEYQAPSSSTDTPSYAVTPTPTLSPTPTVAPMELPVEPDE